MLAATVQLYDIDDVEGFVCATLERAGLGGVPAAEKEELVGDGIRILYELAEKFEPHRPGYNQPGRFSGFAAQFLPRRLGDVWHSSHPEHHRVTDPDGSRRWVYAEMPISLDQFLAGDRRGEDGHGGGPESRIRPPSQLARLRVQPA